MAKTRIETLDLEADELTDTLLAGEGMVLALADLSRRVRITEAEPWYEVGSRWSRVRQMTPGDLWNPVYYKMLQSLVVAKPESETGSCVQLCEAEYYDPRAGIFVPRLEVDAAIFRPKEGDIARYLGMTKDQVSRLVLSEDKGTLIITPDPTGGFR